MAASAAVPRVLILNCGEAADVDKAVEELVRVEPAG
jgi:hypothetical protein